MNFKIVEGKEELWNRAEEFMKYYNDNSITIPNIIKKMGITHNQYRRLRNYCEENGLIVLRRRSPNQKKKQRLPPKYYHFNNKSYCVNKTLNGKTTYYGSYKNKWEAEAVVEKLKQCNWDKNQLDMIKEEVLNGRV